jgi:hypoxanthine-guanine phosphoribosyltransferase
MISNGEIKDTIKSLANQIKEDYHGCRPVMVSVLKGASPVRLSTKRKNSGIGSLV